MPCNGLRVAVPRAYKRAIPQRIKREFPERMISELVSPNVKRARDIDGSDTKSHTTEFRLGVKGFACTSKAYFRGLEEGTVNVRNLFEPPSK